MSGKQMKKLRKACRDAKVNTTAQGYKLQTLEKTVLMTPEIHARIEDWVRQKYGMGDRVTLEKELKNIPEVGKMFTYTAGQRVAADDNRRTYKELKRVYNENKGGRDGFKTIADHIARNQASTPVGPVSPDDQGIEVSGTDGEAV